MRKKFLKISISIIVISLIILTFIFVIFIKNSNSMWIDVNNTNITDNIVDLINDWASFNDVNLFLSGRVKWCYYIESNDFWFVYWVLLKSNHFIKTNDNNNIYIYSNNFKVDNNKINLINQKINECKSN